MKVLECSSKGDKRFSALYAKVSVDGELDSIENHYQKSKVFRNIETGETFQCTDFKKAKALQYKTKEYEIIGFYVGDRYFRKKHLTTWYKALWYKYLCNNPHLIEVINQYDSFSDVFKKPNTINSQADVMQQVKDFGIDSLFQEIKSFLDDIKNNK